MKHRLPYWAYALFTVCIWGSITVFSKIGMRTFSPNSLGLLRTLGACIPCIVYAIVTRMGFPPLRDWPKFFLSGGLAFFLNTVVVNYAATQLNTATVNIFSAIIPVLSSVLAWVVLRERSRWYIWLAFLVEFTGILVLLLWDSTIIINGGVLWSAASVLCMSFYNLSQRLLVRQYSAMQITTYSIIAGTIPMLWYLPQTLRELPAASPAVLLSAAYLGVFGSFLSYAAWARAMAIARRTSDVSNFMFLIPPLATLLGFLVLGEAPTINVYLGGAVVLAGMGISAWGVHREQSRAGQAATFCRQKGL